MTTPQRDIGTLPWVAKTSWFGATASEVEMPLPGDDIIASPVFEARHTVTIDAPAEKIWPWLTQIGQRRAGFYSDSAWWNACVDLYYRLLSREQGRPAERYRHDDERIVPAWQDLSEGEPILDGPPGTARYIVRRIEANRSLVLFTDTHLPYMVPARFRNWVTGEVSASYLLLPLGDGESRVLRRMRMTCDPPAFRLIAVPLVLVWGELITTRNLLRGLRRRAEGTWVSDEGKTRGL